MSSCAFPVVFGGTQAGGVDLGHLGGFDETATVRPPDHKANSNRLITTAHHSVRAATQLSADAPAALAGGHAASGTALYQGSKLFPRRSQRGVHVRPLGVSEIMSLPWPTECAVEHLLDGTQGDPIVLGSDQEIEAGERSIEKLGLGRGQVFEPRSSLRAPRRRTGPSALCAFASSQHGRAHLVRDPRR
jgi:hypothetical protein